jgi:hypothetical protein
MDVAAVVLRAVLGVAGIWYLLTLPRTLKRALARHAAWETGTQHTAATKAARWERRRAVAAVSGIGLFLLMAGSALVGAPVLVTTALLAAMGLTVGVYLVSSAAAGWYEGKASLH